MGKIFANQISDKELELRIYRETALNSETMNTPIFKWVKNVNRHFSKEDIYTWPVSTGKDGQYP